MLDVLTSKVLPRVNSVSLRNMESEQEVVAKFIYASLQNGLNTLILNEYCTSRIILNYYINSLQFLLINKLVHSSLIIRDAEISSQIFSILLSAAATCPISLELGWIQIHDFEELKLEAAEQDLNLWGLEVSYSALGDQGKDLDIKLMKFLIYTTSLYCITL